LSNLNNLEGPGGGVGKCPNSENTSYEGGSAVPYWEGKSLNPKSSKLACFFPD